MSLLEEIQAAAIDDHVGISVVLRKCQVLATRLGNNDFKSWVEHELNGYNSVEELPKYRILKVASYGDFFGSFQTSLKNAPIPPSSIPEEYRKVVDTEYLTDAISFFEALVKENNKEGVLKFSWPADVIRYFSSKIYINMNCASAWRLIPTSSISALLDTVRNRILSFVLEIEAEAPEAGEARQNPKPVSDERIHQVFNTYIMGNGSSVTSINQSVIGEIDIKVSHNDLESLKVFLESQGVSEPDIEELDHAIKDDAKSGKQGIGTNVGSWIGKMVGKAASGVWKIAMDTASSLLTKALAKYYGLES